VPYTLGFIDDFEWDQHFADHGADLGTATRDDYLRIADEFLGRYQNVLYTGPD
jgi:hypothetical protein